MSKLSIIIKREYLRRVSKKSFLLLTFLMPLMFAAMVFVPLWLSSFKSSDVYKIAIVDQTGKYESLFENTDNYHFISSEKSLEEYSKADRKDIFAFLSITGDILEDNNAATLYSEKQIPNDLSQIVNRAITRKLEEEKIASYDIPNLEEIIKDSKVRFSIRTMKWADDGSEKETSAKLASVIGMVLTILIYMFIIMYGNMVMQGVMEEKTNRIVELIISSVKPFDLMMGKIVGIGLVGLTQVFLWGILTMALTIIIPIALGIGVNPDQMIAMQPSQNEMQALLAETNPDLLVLLNTINITEVGIFFILYFIGGYFLYASIFAAIGSAINNQEDSSQFMSPIIALMVFSLYAGMYSMNNPDGPLAFWCSIIPLTSPIVMMTRMPFDVPLWEKLISLTLLYGTAILMTWFSGKIYRVGILMYGKKPSVKELIKWIKYK
jgi:ABC-type Na+ efflux pump, permease component